MIIVFTNLYFILTEYFIQISESDTTIFYTGIPFLQTYFNYYWLLTYVVYIFI